MHLENVIRQRDWNVAALVISNHQFELMNVEKTITVAVQLKYRKICSFFECQMKYTNVKIVAVKYEPIEIFDAFFDDD